MKSFSPCVTGSFNTFNFGFGRDVPFADGMISVLLHFLLRNAFEIRTLLDGVTAVNGENISRRNPRETHS